MCLNLIPLLKEVFCSLNKYVFEAVFANLWLNIEV